MHIRYAIAAVMLACAAPAWAAGEPAPVQAFFSNPAFGGAQLSPSGRYVAARASSSGSRQRLAVYEIATGKAQVVAQFEDADVDQFRWISETRLLFDVTEQELAQGDVDLAPGLYAVNRDGTGFLQLAERKNDAIRAFQRQQMLPWHTFMLPQAGKQDSEYVYVLNAHFTGLTEIGHTALLRLNTLTGLASSVQGPLHAKDWVLDFDGEPRLAVVSDQGRESVQYRDPKKNNTWRVVADFDRYLGGVGSFEPIAFARDGKLYVRANAGRDLSAVYTFDFETGKLSSTPVIVQEEFDFNGTLIFGAQGLRGVHYTSDTESAHWFDPKMVALQRQVDALLPGTVNILTPPVNPETDNVLVKAYSDVQPPVFLVYDGTAKTLLRLGGALPDIPAQDMGKRELLHYQASDGLRIPAWLTLPKGKSKNLPMVVLVHGGPWIRGSSWAFDDEAQFLASRGYAVLQPEFRGSTGFGYALFRAGWKQWGLKMQDDIADGARWAIARGYADPRRICIAGASYGGYAALMGLINDPTVFRCGVSWAGVTDINLMYNGHWSAASDFSDAWKEFGMPALIGDQQHDAEQLKRTSPLLQATRIHQPLLLAYGGADMRVPIYHGRKFRDAIRHSNAKLQWLEYPEEGHGWRLPKNRFDFWTRVEKFLDQNIGAGAKTE